MLSELIMQSVEVDPEKRPASMDFVADRLELIYGKLLAGQKRDGANGGTSSNGDEP
jgi:hypothetical protein